MTVDADLRVANNESESRFEATLDGTLAAVCDYRLADGAIIFPHTETMPAYRGRGIAAALVEFALRDARARGLRIVSRCWFVDEYIASHPEYA